MLLSQIDVLFCHRGAPVGPTTVESSGRASTRMLSPVNAIVINEDDKKHVVRIYETSRGLAMRQDDLSAVMGCDCTGVDGVDPFVIGPVSIAQVVMFTVRDVVAICRVIDTAAAWELHGELQKMLMYLELMDSLGRIEGHLAAIARRGH